jgi:thiosulfate reductase cytochrome b subunit
VIRKCVGMQYSAVVFELQQLCRMHVVYNILWLTILTGLCLMQTESDIMLVKRRVF